MTRLHQYIKIEKPVVISVFANNGDQDQLETNIEENLLRLSLAACPHIQYYSLSNADADDIIDTFNMYKNQVGIFHFGGHANETHLFLEDTPANASGIVKLIREHGSLPLVFLNGCSTKGQVDLLLEAGVAAVIATEVDIADDVAIRFADRFYKSLSQNYPIGKSFADAKNDMEIRDATGDFELYVGDHSIRNIELAELANFVNRKRLLLPYAKWLEKQHSTVPIIGLKSTSDIELDQIFVALRGEISKSFEIFQTQKQLEEALEELEQSWSDKELTELEKQQEKSRLLGRTAIMPSIEERDLRWIKQGKEDGNLTVSDAFLGHEKLVILGDPGTGKTTLARWIVLMFARSIIRDNHNRDSSQGVKNTSRQESIDLGKLRLPILIRVADFEKSFAQNPSITIESFLGQQYWEDYPRFPEDAGAFAGQRIDPEALHNLMIDYIEKGEAVLILDGLDEVSDETSRKKIATAIEEFILTVFDTPKANGLSQRNKLLITSRIAGYHVSPIRNEELFHVTIQPMDKFATARFCHTWIRAVHTSENQHRKKLQVEFEAYERTQRLISLIFDPKRPGIRDLAGNPLLLSQLCRIFYVDQQQLPETRIELYEKAVYNFLQVWENRFRSKTDSFDTYKQKVLLILEDIAEYIHENYPTGLILKGEVENLTERSLETFYRENPHASHTQSIEVEQKAFLKTIREEVGVLAARGEDLYGFLHLTFEEYFAAKKLLRNRDEISKTIISKAYQPRWREPLLLAISYLNSTVPLKQERNSVLKALLEKQDTMGNIVPRSANLLALAFPEMRYQVDGSFVQEVILKLLTAYIGTECLEDGEILRANVEETFLALTKSQEIWQVVIETFVMIFRSDQFDDRFKNGVAYLIEKGEWYGDLPAETFILARKHDLPIWKWPIHRILQKFANERPDKLDHPDLSLRTYLKEYPEAIQFISNNSSWILLILLLYGGIVETKSDNKTSFDFSTNGIIEDSFLTEKIIDLIENKQPPHSLLEFCTGYWHDEEHALQDCIDSILVLVALNESILIGVEKLTGISGSVGDALITRLDRLMVTLQAAVGATARGISVEFVQSIVENSEPEHIYRLLLQLFQLGLTYGEKTPNPITWMEGVPGAIQSKMLAEFWVVPFLNSDDAEYNIAVSLDTVGAQIEEMGPLKIAESFARIGEVVNLPPFDKWKVERIPYEPRDQHDILEEALSNLAKLDSEFDVLKYWGLKQIIPLLEENPELKASGITSIILGMESRLYFEKIIGLAFPNLDVLDQPNEKIVDRNGQFFVALHLPGDYIRNGSSLFRLDDIPKDRPDKQLKLLFEILSILRRSGSSVSTDIANHHDIFDEVLVSATSYIEKISKPEIQARGYIKLAFFYSDVTRKDLIRNALKKTEQIENLFVLAQILKEMRPWVLNDAGLLEQFLQGKARIEHPYHRAVLENGSYPFFLGLSNVPKEMAAFGILAAGALVRDSKQLFSFPREIDGLWEYLLDPNALHTEEIVNQIHERGRTNRHRVTTLAALALSRLRETGRQDLILELATSIEQPVPEAIPLISAWIDDTNSRIRAFASLLLLEAGVLNAQSFPGLESILFANAFGQQDQMRNRVNFALNNQSFNASMIGTEGLELIEKAIINHADRVPYLVKALSWTREHITFDSPEIIEYFVSEAQRSGRKARVAFRILQSIHRIKGKETIQAYLNGFLIDDVEIQKRLLYSSIQVLRKWQRSFLEKYDFRDDIRKCIRAAVQSSDVEVQSFALDAIGYLPDLKDDDKELLRAQIDHGVPKHQYLALIALGRSAFEEEEQFLRSFFHHQDNNLRLAASEAYARHIIRQHGESADTLPKIEESLDSEPSIILHVLLNAAKNLWWDGYSKNCFKILGDFFEKHEHQYASFVKRIVPVLSTRSNENHDLAYEQSTAWMEQMVYLDALAAGAERLPATFSRQARQISGFDTLLQQVVLKSKVFTDRMNAISCLSYTRRMTQACIDSFCAALKDIAEVQDTAINSAHRFWEADSRFIRAISNQMDQETLSARYAMLKILIATGTYHKTDPNIRQQILDVLLEKMNDKNNHDDVYVFIKKVGYFQRSDGSEGVSDLGKTVEHIGLLNYEMYRSILEIAGLRSKVKS